MVPGGGSIPRPTGIGVECAAGRGLARGLDVALHSAVSALFIWVNSASGMAGQLSSGIQLSSNAWIFVSVAVVGGYIGGLVGSKKMNNRALRYLLAFVLVLASVKLFLV